MIPNFGILYTKPSGFLFVEISDTKLGYREIRCNYVIPVRTLIKGQKAQPKRIVRSWKQHTLLLAISNDGDIKFQVFQGTCNRIKFHQFILNLPGDIICDNALLSIHEGLDMQNIAFVPPYSPKIYDFKSCRNGFSCCKNCF
jgi:hypothetical protein